MNVEVRQSAGGNYEIGVVIEGHWVPFHSLDPQTVQMVGVPEEQASKEVKTPDETLAEQEAQASAEPVAPAQ